jgi:hypothetical protein
MTSPDYAMHSHATASVFELTDHPVSTWSEEWRIEREA